MSASVNPGSAPSRRASRRQRPPATGGDQRALGPRRDRLRAGSPAAICSNRSSKVDRPAQQAPGAFEQVALDAGDVRRFGTIRNGSSSRRAR
jgi:hypothetical protein